MLHDYLNPHMEKARKDFEHQYEIARCYSCGTILTELDDVYYAPICEDGKEDRGRLDYESVTVAFCRECVPESYLTQN